MSRYIDAKQVQEAIKEVCEEYGIAYGGRHGGFAEKIAKVTDTIPSADVQEISHGKWRRIQNYALCTCCKHEVNWGNDDYLSPYCPQCGAKMDKECESNG